jgi:formate-dependent nitrite reductase cytochrome c552 subunit
MSKPLKDVLDACEHCHGDDRAKLRKARALINQKLAELDGTDDTPPVHRQVMANLARLKENRKKAKESN